MNLFEMQEFVETLSEPQLAQQMKAPTGEFPQFLFLSEMNRRKDRKQKYTNMMAQKPETTVAEDVVAASGVPQGGIQQMAQSMAPQTSMGQNTGQMGGPTPVQSMFNGGLVGSPAPVGRFADGRMPYSAAQLRRMDPQARQQILEYLAAVEEEELGPYGAPMDMGEPPQSGSVPRGIPGPDRMPEPMLEMLGMFEPEMDSLSDIDATSFPRDNDGLGMFETHAPPNVFENEGPAMTSFDRSGVLPSRLQMGQRGGGAEGMPQMGTPGQLPPPVGYDDPMMTDVDYDDPTLAPRGGQKPSTDYADDARAARRMGVAAAGDGVFTPANMGTMGSNLATAGDARVAANAAPPRDPRDNAFLNLGSGVGLDIDGVDIDATAISRPRSRPDPEQPVGPDARLPAGPALPVPDNPNGAVRGGGSSGGTGSSMASMKSSASGDDFYEQDKWLALARVGFAAMMMPLGQAAGVGMDALMKARSDYQERKQTAELMALKRAAAARSGGRRGASSVKLPKTTDLARVLEELRIRQDVLGGPTLEGAKAAGKLAEWQAVTDEINSISDLMVYSGTRGISGRATLGGDSLSDVDATKG